MFRKAVPLAILAALLSATLVQAHAYIESSEPEDGAALAGPPAEVRIRYTESVETRVTQLTLLDAAGRPVPGTRQHSMSDRELILQLPRLSDGEYQVKSATLGRDGHATESTLWFSIAAGGQAPSPTATAGEAPPDPDGLNVGVAPSQAMEPMEDSNVAERLRQAQERFKPFVLLGAALATLLILGAILYGLLTRRQYLEDSGRK